MPVPAPVDIVTQHGNNARTGHYGSESALTLANVRQATFGKVGFFTTDGQVDAQPLFLSGVNLPGKGVRDVLYVVTQRASAYAFDAVTGEELWKVTWDPLESTCRHASLSIL